MKMLALLFTIVVMTTVAKCEIEPSGFYTHWTVLASDPVVKLLWNYTDTRIIFEVHGNTNGWIGIGLSPNGGMTGADIFVGWVKNGVAKVTDRHGVANGFPPLDPQQDVDVLGGAECDGWTMLKFSRQLAACEHNDKEIPGGTQRLIWALGETDPTSDDIVPEFDAYYHGRNRGVKSMYLLSPIDLPRDDGLITENVKTFDITTKNFAIPATKTHYNCRIVELPTLNKKHHIVKFEPVIQKGNEVHVHHILVMSCGQMLQGTWEVGVDRACSSTDPTNFCLEVIVGWGVGGTSAILPDVAGIPIGTDKDPRYLMLQTHYDNPEELPDVTDSSGIRITYTSKLRQHDSGVIVVGQTVAGNMHYIPPGADRFLTVVDCMPECLGNKIREAGFESLTVHQVLLHSHLAGRSMRLRHIRNGTELPYIARDETYNFNYQQYMPLDPVVTILPDDIIQMECVYSTVGRDNVTEAGDATSQEMCFAFFGYYPRIEFSNCQSTVPEHLSWEYFGIESTVRIGHPLRLDGYKITKPDQLAGKTPLEVISEFHWSKDSIEDFNSYLNALEHDQYCVGIDAQKLNTFKFHLTKIEKPYLAPQRICEKASSALRQSIASEECQRQSTVATDSEIATTDEGSCLKASFYLLIASFSFTVRSLALV